MQQHNILLVLGAPNDDKGELSAIAKSRAQKALSEYRKIHNSKILLTGGYGQQFNTTTMPHAHYLAKFLFEHGLPNSALLGFVESANTVEDAFLSKLFLTNYRVKNLHIVTSKFHLARVKKIFTHFFLRCPLRYIGATCPLTSIELSRVVQHEKKTIEAIEKNGILLPSNTAERGHWDIGEFKCNTMFLSATQPKTF